MRNDIPERKQILVRYLTAQGKPMLIFRNEHVGDKYTIYLASTGYSTIDRSLILDVTTRADMKSEKVKALLEEWENLEHQFYNAHTSPPEEYGDTRKLKFIEPPNHFSKMLKKLEELVGHDAPFIDSNLDVHFPCRKRSWEGATDLGNGWKIACANGYLHLYNMNRVNNRVLVGLLITTNYFCGWIANRTYSTGGKLPKPMETQTFLHDAVKALREGFLG